jgi:hypothetical protein
VVEPGDRVRVAYRVWFRGKVDTKEYYNRMLLSKALEEVDRKIRSEMETRGFELESAACSLPAEPLTDHVDLLLVFKKVRDPLPLVQVVVALALAIAGIIALYFLVKAVETLWVKVEKSPALPVVGGVVGLAILYLIYRILSEVRR